MNTIALAALQPAADEHAFIAGKNGSGKTVMGYVLVRQSYLPVLVHDGKGRIKQWPGFEIARTFADFYRKAQRGPRVIWKPNESEGRDPAMHEAFYRFAYLRAKKDGIGSKVYTDELGSAIRYGVPPSLEDILTRGRELHVTAITSTQRPMDIPQELMSEAKRYYIFRLTMPQDRKKISEVIPVDGARLATLPTERFLYYHDGRNEAMPWPPTKPDGYHLAVPKEVLRVL